MAKAASIKIKLVSSADTGFYYVTKKNSRTQTEKMVKKKYGLQSLWGRHPARERFRTAAVDNGNNS
jgi:large subunit ribosomal protein L33